MSKGKGTLIQTSGTLMVLVGIVVAAITGANHGGTIGEDWVADSGVYLALFLVIVGIVVSIVGRVKSGGPA